MEDILFTITIITNVFCNKQKIRYCSPGCGAAMKFALTLNKSFLVIYLLVKLLAFYLLNCSDPSRIKLVKRKRLRFKIIYLN